MVELRSRLIVLRGPGLAAVGGDGCAAIIAVDHPPRVFWINPQAVIVAMRRTQRNESTAAISGARQGSVQDVNRVHRFRIGKDVIEIPGTLRVIGVLVDARPGVAAIVGPIDAATLGLDQRINALRIAARDRYANASEHAFREAFALQLLPRAAGIGRFVKPAAWAAAGHGPWRARNLVQRGVEDVWIRGIEDQINGASLVVLVEDLLPTLAAIG